MCDQWWNYTLLWRLRDRDIEIHVTRLAQFGCLILSVDYLLSGSVFLKTSILGMLRELVFETVIFNNSEI